MSRAHRRACWHPGIHPLSAPTARRQDCPRSSRSVPACLVIRSHPAGARAPKPSGSCVPALESCVPALAGREHASACLTERLLPLGVPGPCQDEVSHGATPQALSPPSPHDNFNGARATRGQTAAPSTTRETCASSLANTCPPPVPHRRRRGEGRARGNEAEGLRSGGLSPGAKTWRHFADAHSPLRAGGDHDQLLAVSRQAQLPTRSTLDGIRSAKELILSLMQVACRFSLSPALRCSCCCALVCVRILVVSVCLGPWFDCANAAAAGRGWIGTRAQGRRGPSIRNGGDAAYSALIYTGRVSVGAACWTHGRAAHCTPGHAPYSNRPAHGRKERVNAG